MEKVKYSILILVILGGLFFLFGPEVSLENFQFQEVLNLASQNDVIIIFNSGGWGNTPLEEAQDFAPIIKGIQQTLNEWGYNSVVVPYIRTKDNLLGKITGTQDFLSSFNSSSEILAKDLEFLAENLPGKKIIIAGLSNGATFVNKTYEKISEEVKNSIYTIAAGTPFWTKTIESDNVLQLDNDGRDSLSKGDIQPLVLSLIKAPYQWLCSKFKGQNLSFSQVIQVPGHEYFWNSFEVGPQIVTFLEDKFR